MKFRDILLEVIVRNAYDDDGVYNQKNEESPLFKEYELLNKNDILYIMDNIPSKISKIYTKRISFFGNEDIEIIYQFLGKLIVGYENDFEIFIKALNLFKILFNLKVEDDKVIDLVENNDPYFNWSQISVLSSSVQVLGSFNFKSFSKDQISEIENYILNNIDDLSISLGYLKYKHGKKSVAIKKLCYELMMSLPFSESFILNNYNLFLPWIILKNKNIEATQKTNNCIFGDMTKHAMTQILKYVSNNNFEEFKIDESQISNNILLYLLTKNEKGEN